MDKPLTGKTGFLSEELLCIINFDRGASPPPPTKSTKSNFAPPPHKSGSCATEHMINVRNKLV